MAKFVPHSLISLFLLSLLISGSSAGQLWGNLGAQQMQHRLRARTLCRVDSLNAQEPTRRFQSEAGRTEFWDRNNQQFECAGVAAVKNYMNPRALLLPHYNNAPQILYVIRGRGILGVLFPGCAETFEQESQQPREEDPRRRFTDRHQKVRRFREGDVLALPAGVTLWFYNNGQEELQTVALLDTSNEINQLDQTFRNFFLAGKPRGGSEERGERKNILSGFDDEILSEVFNINRVTARKLRSENDERGQIVNAENFEVVLPRDEEDEEESRYMANGLEETFCTARLKENLDDASRADVYNPRGGRISSLNSQKLPILNYLRLSAEKGVLYRNALMAPHYNVNAHAAIYIIRGRARFQVVGHTGKSVFDGHVRQGQMIIVPQNFVVVKKASVDEGLEYISFKTNDNAVTSQLAGRLSTFRALPEDVLVNAYGISRQEARNLKYNREESRVFSSRFQSRRSRPFEYAMDVIKYVM